MGPQLHHQGLEPASFLGPWPEESSKVTRGKRYF